MTRSIQVIIFGMFISGVASAAQFAPQPPKVYQPSKNCGFYKSSTGPSQADGDELARSCEESVKTCMADFFENSCRPPATGVIGWNTSPNTTNAYSAPYCVCSLVYVSEGGSNPYPKYWTCRGSVFTMCNERQVQ